MFSRREFHKRVSQTFAFSACVGATGLLPATAEAQLSHSARIANLKEQLEKGLMARRPQDFKFVAKVLQLVKKGKIKQSLVQETFLWARNRAKYRRYPFPYFEFALRYRCKKLGIII